ncbi:Multivesicular body subunit 12B [Desmophyllum pertusum]|uniref:Multivesicular body subunit 12B n=1 Tax=Desmophyllum pertusum TaxID=174260 RepID=A0A9W9Z8D7_9CNID|nr:Multivesicular body subunit 12B [Desmophyllum pertusum]
MQTAQFPPITDIKIVSQKERCPARYFMLAKTVQGMMASYLTVHGGTKGSVISGFTREAGQNVIEDLTVIGEEDSVPAGRTTITKAHDDDDKALRKHFLCLKIQSSKTAASAVCDIVLINRTKGEQAPPGYHLITNEVNNLSICFKMAPVVRHQPGPPAGHQDNIYSVPPYLGPNRQNWYGQAPGPWQQQPGYQAPPPLPAKAGASSGIDGLPFELNSKF